MTQHAPLEKQFLESLQLALKPHDWLVLLELTQVQAIGENTPLFLGVDGKEVELESTQAQLSVVEEEQDKQLVFELSHFVTTAEEQNTSRYVLTLTEQGPPLKASSLTLLVVGQMVELGILPSEVRTQAEQKLSAEIPPQAPTNQTLPQAKLLWSLQAGPALALSNFSGQGGRVGVALSRGPWHLNFQLQQLWGSNQPVARSEAEHRDSSAQLTLQRGFQLTPERWSLLLGIGPQWTRHFLRYEMRSGAEPIDDVVHGIALQAQLVLSFRLAPAFSLLLGLQPAYSIDKVILKDNGITIYNKNDITIYSFLLLSYQWGSLR